MMRANPYYDVIMSSVCRRFEIVGLGGVDGECIVRICWKSRVKFLVQISSSNDVLKDENKE
jgi:hypothetical protein